MLIQEQYISKLGCEASSWCLPGEKQENFISMEQHAERSGNFTPANYKINLAQSGQLPSCGSRTNYMMSHIDSAPCYPMYTGNEHLNGSGAERSNNYFLHEYPSNYSYAKPYCSYDSCDMSDVADGNYCKNTSRESTKVLKTWLLEHNKNPYPSKGEKTMLAILTKMTLTQVSTWFANARRRLKKENKMTWSPKNRTGELSSKLDVSIVEDENTIGNIGKVYQHTKCSKPTEEGAVIDHRHTQTLPHIREFGRYSFLEDLDLSLNQPNTGITAENTWAVRSPTESGNFSSGSMCCSPLNSQSISNQTQGFNASPQHFSNDEIISREPQMQTVPIQPCRKMMQRTSFNYEQIRDLHQGHPASMDASVSTNSGLPRSDIHSCSYQKHSFDHHIKQQSIKNNFDLQIPQIDHISLPCHNLRAAVPDNHGHNKPSHEDTKNSECTFNFSTGFPPTSSVLESAINCRNYHSQSQLSQGYFSPDRMQQTRTPTRCATKSSQPVLRNIAPPEPTYNQAFQQNIPANHAISSYPQIAQVAKSITPTGGDSMLYSTPTCYQSTKRNDYLQQQIDNRLSTYATIETCDATTTQNSIPSFQPYQQQGGYSGEITNSSEQQWSHRLCGRIVNVSNSASILADRPTPERGLS